MRVEIALCGLLSFTLLTSCNHVVRNSPTITGYKNAECIPTRADDSESNPPTRMWDVSLKASSGENIRIRGAQMPGGRIDVQYASDGSIVTAANAGDYIYPADVRIDKSKQRLFVKASGITAVFDRPQTWLFEFDLNRRSQIDRARVDPAVLPQECHAN
jgi:hypothetical protein